MVILLLNIEALGKKYNWLGFYYPDASSLIIYIRSPELYSYDECVGWVNNLVNQYNPEGSGYDYECGRKCRFDKNFEGYICKETIK